MSSNTIQRKARASSNGRHHTEEEGGGDDDGGGTIAVHTAILSEQKGDAADGGNIKDDDIAAKKDDADGPTPLSSSSVAIKDLKLLWILFQCLWPAVLLTLCDHITMSHVLFPYAITFWLVSFGIRGNKSKSLLLRHRGTKISYHQLYGWEFTYWANQIWANQLVLAFLMCIVLGPKKMLELGFKNICQGLVIVLSGRFDAFERWVTKFLPESYPRPEDYLEEGGDEEGAAKDEHKIQNLEHLEKLSKEGKLKKPTWVLVVLGIAAVWQFAFLFYFDKVLVLFNIEGSSLQVKKLNYGGKWMKMDDRLRPLPVSEYGRPKYFDEGYAHFDEEYAVELTAETFEGYLDNHDAAFINFYAP